ncbi:MAG: tRNA uridine-5-carboxymethylaminomethyl(34) synthesis GTPase MnmE, partial [Alphaproteobacteria bacterium]
VRCAEEADLILHVQDGTHWPMVEKLPSSLRTKQVITVWNKKDKMEMSAVSLIQELCLSAQTGEGIEALWLVIKDILSGRMNAATGALITRERYRVALRECQGALERALSAIELELKAEDLRMAARALGRITGRIEADELLDVIFRDFCIGK